MDRLELALRDEAHRGGIVYQISKASDDSVADTLQSVIEAGLAVRWTSVGRRIDCGSERGCWGWKWQATARLEVCKAFLLARVGVAGRLGDDGINRSRS